MKTKNIIYFVIGLAIMFFLMKRCEGEPKIVTKTETKIVTVHDTITNTIIEKVPKTVYIERTKTIKGKDSIIYKDKPSETTIEANKYQTKITSNEATADLEITTTGELLDLQGFITYPKVIEKTTTTITRDASGFFLYGKAPITSSISPELGIMFNVKNKMIIGAGVQYSNFTNNVNATVTLAIKL